jgi:hypothetical protein
LVVLWDKVSPGLALLKHQENGICRYNTTGNECQLLKKIAAIQ